MTEKSKGGRPSKFNQEMLEQARKLALLGATDEQVADFFEVTKQTINNWKQSHPEFFASLKEGKDELDNQVVKSLFHRAMGYSHPEDKIFNAGGEPMVVPTTKHYPPDTTAAIFWLKNRQPENWRDKTEVTQTNIIDIEEVDEFEMARRVAFLLTKGSASPAAKGKPH